MKQIQIILKQNDVAGILLLHSPGFGEHLVNINTSYSCAKIEGDNLRVKAKLQEDFQGNKTKQVQVLTDTCNMFAILRDMNFPILQGINDMSKKMDDLLEASHTGGNDTSHTSQNN